MLEILVCTIAQPDAIVVLLCYHIWRGTVNASDFGPMGAQNAGEPKSL